MRQLHGCHGRVTCLCGVLALAALAALAGCESEVFGTLSADQVETEQGSLQPGADPAAERREPSSSGDITEGNPVLGGLASGPELPPRTCDGVPVVCRAPVLTADSLPGRTLPPVQTHITDLLNELGEDGWEVVGMTAAFSAGWCMRARLMPLDQ